MNDLILRDRDTDTNGSLDERLYALQDPNWNVVAIANTSGTILKRFCYSAYGAPKYFTSDFSDSTAGYDWETLYCGYRYDYHTDSDVKWHIAGHRILLSHLGRWNRRDPILDDDNPYRYCGNNSLNATDPMGLVAVVCTAYTSLDGRHMTEFEINVTTGDSFKACVQACKDRGYIPAGWRVKGIWGPEWTLDIAALCERIKKSGNKWCCNCQDDCEATFRNLITAAQSIPAPYYFRTETCVSWLKEFEKQPPESQKPDNDCYKTCGVHFKENYSFRGHVAIKVVACDGTTFYLNHPSWWGNKCIFAPQQIPSGWRMNVDCDPWYLERRQLSP